MVTLCPLILCTSVHHGNTARVADAIAGELGAEVAAPASILYTSIRARPLVGIGSGVYYGRMHESIIDWLQGLPDDPEPTTPAFVFSTSGLPWLAWIWHRPVRRLLGRKGFRVVGEFSCGGFDTWGPLWLLGGLNKKHPDDSDLNRGRRFAASMNRMLVPRKASETPPTLADIPQRAPG
jgi:flavodoxin